MSFRNVVCLAGLALAGFTVQAQLLPPEEHPLVGARMPALSPDGKRLAFVYRGDVWVTSSQGGRAVPLTRHIESDAYPIFSPDGKWIAFSSTRNGGWDLFVAPADGGPARQLTWHSGTDVAHGWSPDGKYLLFGAKRDTPNYGLFALDVASLELRRLSEDQATINHPSYSPDGKSVVYGRYGFPWTRPRYVGSAAEQLWIVNADTGYRHRLTEDDHQYLWPKYLPDGKHIVAVTIGEPTPSSSPLSNSIPKIVDSPARTPNLWSLDLDGKRKQLTFFTGGSVRWPSVARKSGDIAFEQGTDIWLLKSGRKDPAQIKIYAAADDKQNLRRHEKLSRELTESEPSIPDGKTYALGLRGDIWTISAEKPKGVAGRSAEFARRLTDWSGDDSDFYWSHDGKKLYFTSDREFNTRLYELDMETLGVKPLWNRDDDVSSPQVSPDGKQLGFWVSGKEGGLYVMPREGGEPRRLAKFPGSHSSYSDMGEFAWSPDMKWVAFTRPAESLAYNIWIVAADGGEPVNVTRLNASHGLPTWSPDGKYLFFQSNREGEGLYSLALTPEAVRLVDTDFSFEEPKDKVKVEIDFQDIQRRIRKVVSQSPQSGLNVTSKGLILFISDGDVYQVSYDGKESKRLTTGGGKVGLRVTQDGKKASYLQSGELYSFRLGGTASPERITFTADWDRDVRAERKAAFTHFWRAYHRGFYDPNFHGRDWEAIRKRYEPLVDAVETNEEFATLLNMMIGELEASHSEVTPSSGGSSQPVTPHLGFTFDYAYAGPGIKVAEVPRGAPGSYKKTLIKSGEYVMAVNGSECTPGEKLYRAINDKQDREFEFLVNDKPSKEGARKVRYKIMTQREWDELSYQNRTEDLRKRVEDKSAGKLGYLHISAMGFTNQLQFEREVYEYIQGKEGMIIDVRFNRGGNISDTLIDWLERKQHGYFKPRDGQVRPSPLRAWDKPVVVVMNEHSYSNGEMFPYAMRQHGLAKLVGMPTPGYVIWTSEFRLTEGTGARMPGSGVFRMDGSNMENNGERPDVQVWLSPEDWLAGRDPQLDKAIEMLMK